MSNSLAIAAVTATLRSLLTHGIPELPNQKVTTQPLDKARPPGNSPDQVNLFLYQTMINGAWRNMDLPRQVKPGETGQPPLALNLYYLLTAYGENDDEAKSHRWLGKAMSVLHDHPLLGAQEIKDALADSGLDLQIERVRITPQPLSLDEMSKLWTTFQTNYRLSSAYQVEVVLIESTRAVTAPLPVLKRGPSDQGVSAVAGAPPTLTAVVPDVEPPGVQLSAQLGNDIIIKGRQLPGDGFSVRFSNLRLDNVITLTQTLPGSGADQVRYHLPTAAEDATALATWTPGFYNVSLLVKQPDPLVWATNEVPFMLAPSIKMTSSLNQAAGNLTIELECTPRLRDGARVTLLFGASQFPPKTIATPADSTLPSSLTFDLAAITPGAYVVRLRVDGVDSLPVIRDGDPLVLKFDPAQTVTIT